MPNLFDPIDLGDIHCPNRILMAPLTRGRASPGHIPNDMMRLYYEQRASAGLIISEATGISQEGLGWPSAPGIWTEAQTEGWKPITEAVHKAGGRIILQLWHMGRLVHSSFNNGAPASRHRPPQALAMPIPQRVSSRWNRPVPCGWMKCPAWWQIM